MLSDRSLAYGSYEALDRFSRLSRRRPYALRGWLLSILLPSKVNARNQYLPGS